MAKQSSNVVQMVLSTRTVHSGDDMLAGDDYDTL
jgi:hypothetical protein